MIEAVYYKKLKDGIVQCSLCPRNCVIDNTRRGVCRARENKGGKLYSLVYGKPCSVNIDQIEKKPLFHFLPGHKSYSIGTAGCNLFCRQCQNWSISQCNPEDAPSLELPPEKIVEEAVRNDCRSISYTYSEPVSTALEYVLDTAKIAKKKGIKNIAVSNGFINEKPLKDACKYLDAANIDLKGNAEFYRKVTGGWIEPVLESLKILKKKRVWLEITNLIIPGYNDNEKEIKKICKWILDNLGSDVPIHFSKFFPMYKLKSIKETPQEVLVKAKKIAEESGIKFVYVGNIFISKAENTYCPKCRNLLIERYGFDVLQNNIKKGRCECGEKIPGVWN